MENKIEIWKDVVGFEGFYQISSFGKVKRIKSFAKHPKGLKKIVKEKILKICNSNGYEIVMLTVDNSRKNKLIHRLVAEAFLKNPENKKHVNHINGIKNDNWVENLEWNTPKENENHKVHVLGIIKNSLNLKHVFEINKPIVINEKKVVGINIQNFYNDLMSGKKISTQDKSYGKIYTLKYLLKTKYNLNIQSRVEGRFKEYFLKL